MPTTKSTTPPPDPEAQDPDEPDEPDEEDVDVDLDLLANDSEYRETLAEPTVIRLPTGDVIEVPHMRDWPHIGTRQMVAGLFDGWAETVLTPEDCKAFREASLHNYQIEKITDAVSASAGVTPGKRRPSSSSRKSTRRR
jgi:hypothetical protein